MADKQLCCITCDNIEICKYADSYKTEMSKVKDNNKHPIFQHTLVCVKYRDKRPSIAYNVGETAKEAH